MSDTDLLTQIRAEVRGEIRLAGLLDVPARPHLPPPHDLDAEQIVASAVLCGHALPSSLAPLLATDFYATIFATIFAICAALEEVERAPTVELVLATLERQGCGGAELEKELLTIRDATPFVLHLVAVAKRITTAARSRRLLDRILRIEALLRVGEIDVDGALTSLREDVP